MRVGDCRAQEGRVLSMLIVHGADVGPDERDVRVYSEHGRGSF